MKMKEGFIKILMYIVLLMTFVYTHEILHRQIAIYHGCENYKLNFGFLDSSFKCTEYIDRTQEMQLQEIKLHSWNELISYNIIIFYVLFIFLKEIK